MAGWEEVDTSAARKRKYRTKLSSLGVKRLDHGVKATKWSRANFIAIDGEGESYGPTETFETGDDGAKYTCQDHRYTLLAASSGESLFNGGERLGSQSCIDWLCDLSDHNPMAIFVIFAGGYDINHILMYGFTKKQLKKLSGGDELWYKVGEIDYCIEFRARKSLTIRRGCEWVIKKDGKGAQVWKSRITLWDVFGFFQENFVGVMGKWLGKTHRHYALIQDMKKRRGDFAHVAQSLINAYNQAELESLVELMKKVHEGIEKLNLKVMRWDGAGSIAAAIFRKETIKQYKAPLKTIPQEAQFAARCAYAGGRIEICKMGYHDGPVYDYDINSAYPSMMHTLPCLAHGAWKKGEGVPPKGFTLCYLKYHFEEGLPFYPLFFRTSRMQISFPSEGEGWYWYPEYETALKFPGDLECLEWWQFEPACDHQPFKWIEDYYETRKKWVKNPDEDWQLGGEKILKLGLNSLYGKTAQQLGGTETQPPSYHQIEWAGYITSATRARLCAAALSAPHSIIGFATDGIFSTRQLTLDHSDRKIMGAWELKQPMPIGMTIVMAGIYWWHHQNNKFTHFSRGFDKESMMTPELILNAWKNKQNEVEIPFHRLIGMGSACASDTFWKMRGRFASGIRKLRLDGKSHKRLATDVGRNKPHTKLCDLKPSLNVEYAYGLQEFSHPYPIKWAMGDGGFDAYENDLEISKENDDTSHI